MDKTDRIPPIRGSILSEVTLVDQIERSEIGDFQSESLPGHLIHICTAARLNTGGWHHAEVRCRP